MYSICSKTCFIAFIFLVGMIYMTFSIDKCEISDSFVDSLNDAQLEQYRLIVKERRNLYIQGFLLGLALSAIYVYYKKIDDKEKIPDYIYEILCMKLSKRSIEKSHFSLLDSQIFLNEKIILEKINKEKILLI